MVALLVHPDTEHLHFRVREEDRGPQSRLLSVMGRLQDPGLPLSYVSTHINHVAINVQSPEIPASWLESASSVMLFHSTVVMAFSVGCC